MKNNLRASLFFVACIAAIPSNGQVGLPDDTINIKEVIITRKQISAAQPGFRITSIDSTMLKYYSHFALADVLNETSPLFIKYYGPGGISTPSFRGTSAGHTLITWNGININDHMLGQSDFSLLPTGMIDNVKISFGGASMDLGDGAIGAIINLENDPLWTRRTLVELNSGIGSFGRYSGLVKAETGTDHFQTVTKAYINSARNNFPFSYTGTSSEQVMEKRINNEMLQKGFMQEFYLRKATNVLSARIWYQSVSRNLPGSVPVDNADEKQSDESLRTLINYDIIKTKSEYFITTAWLFNKLNYDYISEVWPSYSRNRTNTIVLKGGMTTRLGDYTKFKMVFNNDISTVKTNVYAARATRNISSATLSAERRKGDRLGAVVLIRETADGSSLLMPDLSAGMEFRVIRGENHFLKLNVSRNSKIPTLNDRYWNPGGNLDIKNEYAYSSEVGYSLNQNISPVLNAGFDLIFYTNHIRDMIQWRPVDSNYSIWIADNIGSVNSSGLESSLSIKYRISHLLIDLKVSYSYTRAYEINSGSTETKRNQLIYIPENQANGLLKAEYRNLYSAWVTDFTGITYTSADNSVHLPGYTINNFITGYKINLKENLIDMRFKIENLFNVSYQTIANYPQPGRSYYFSLLFQLIK